VSAPLRERVLAFLGEHHVMTLATADARGPWGAAVFYAHDGLRLYFLSSPAARHSACLAGDARVAATIQRDYDDWPGIRGLQLAGAVREVPAADEPRVREIYRRRFPIVGGGAGVPQAILAALRKIRWYELTPSEVWLIDNRLGFAHREHLPCA
jgi:hypothetical protein